MISDYIKGGLKVPVDKNRIKSVVEVAKRIEEDFNVRLEVDQERGEVTIMPKDGTTLDQLMKAKAVIEALSYGFSYEDAVSLKEDDYVLEVIDLRDYVDKNKIHHLLRVKGRIIGENGRAKRTLQELTDTKIVIGDKYVAILGPYENVKITREALRLLIEGRQHATVYRWITSKMRSLKFQHLLEAIKRRGEEELEGLEGEGV